MKTTSTIVETPAEPAAPPALSPDRILGIAHGFWASQVLSAAAAHRFFTHISRGSRTAAQVAAAAGTDPRGTRMVLDSLVALDVLAKRGDRYDLTPEADAFLVEGRPGDVSPLVAGHPALVWDDWAGLRDALATGRPVLGVDRVEAAKEFFPKLIRMLLPLGLGPADALAEHLGAGASRTGLRVIDIGAGGAAWSIPFARRDPAGRVTAFDLAEVLPHTARIVEEHGVADRYQMVGGDYRTADFGDEEYDLAVLGNICHLEAPEANRHLFARIRRALKPGGLLLIADMIPDDDRTGPSFPVLFALNMYLHASGGDTYTFPEYREWLLAAGFRDVSAFDTRRSHSPVIIAAR